MAVNSKRFAPNSKTVFSPIRKGGVGRQRVLIGHAMYFVEGYPTMQIGKGIETWNT